MPDRTPQRMPHRVRDDARERPDLRWDPGARYRPSVLAGLPSLKPALKPAPAAPVPQAHRLAGRLRRGPAARTAVFDRDLWRPVQHVTTGLVRVVGRALAR
ncbi:hypothetical protein [Krasilnikoviella flava]|uniref:Uncharacterized protein n=1 Tax=Krasilnikoviella flava TaxID=526729 RepID=A0A1T5L6A9_9MICO|nr:hypothetical protein [Krasilnikoviella flava]SKC71149.1 hypothetical protein SAMN04324258_2894 [Krasilnikoviella flava]